MKIQQTSFCTKINGRWFFTNVYFTWRTFSKTKNSTCETKYERKTHVIESHHWLIIPHMMQIQRKHFKEHERTKNQTTYARDFLHRHYRRSYMGASLKTNYQRWDHCTENRLQQESSVHKWQVLRESSTGWSVGRLRIFFVCISGSTADWNAKCYGERDTDLPRY